MQLGTGLRNALAGEIQTYVGASPLLRFYSGAVPANCAASAPSGLLVTLTLPSTWLTTPTGGTAALTGTWTGTVSSSGTVASYRFYESTGTTCMAQGPASGMTGGGDFLFSNPALVSAQTVNITANNFNVLNA